MVYICLMVHGITGDFIKYFGTRQECMSRSNLSPPGYTSEVRLATLAELLNQIEVVEQRRARIEYNASFAKGEDKQSFAESIALVDEQLVNLRASVERLRLVTNEQLQSEEQFSWDIFPENENKESEAA